MFDRPRATLKPLQVRSIPLRLLAGLVAIPLVVAAVSNTSAATRSASLTPVADTWVNATRPAANYGASTSLRVDSSPVRMAFLRFDASATTGTVSRVVLRLHPNSSNYAGVSVHPVATNSWSEMSTTAANAPAVGTAAVNSGPIVAGRNVDIDVTSLVNAGGLTSLAVLDRNGTSISLASRESSNPPLLVLYGGGTYSLTQRPTTSSAPMATASPVAGATSSPAATPTATAPSSSPSATPTLAPNIQPTVAPTARPTAVPTPRPTATTAPTSATTPVPAAAGWVLVVDDEFNSGGVPSHWQSYDGAYGSGPQNCAIPSHAAVSGGYLHMTMGYETSGPCGAGWYTAGLALSGFSTVDQQVTVRFRIVDSGVAAHFIIPMRWPDNDASWPAGGEEDYCESDTAAGCSSFLHYGASNSQVWHDYSVDFTSWHTVRFTRLNNVVSAYMDNMTTPVWTYAGTSSTLPNTIKHVVLQQECQSSCPSGTTGSEDIQVDWITVEDPG